MAQTTLPDTSRAERAFNGARILAAVGILLAAVLLYFSLRGIEWREVARTVRDASIGRLVLASALSSVTLFLRAMRWRVLLNAEGSVGASTAFWATAGGYFGNNFLPARAGELVRTLMVSSQSGLDKAYVLATALSERVVDAIALVLISACVLLVLPHQPRWLLAAARPFAVLGAVWALAIAVLPLMGSTAQAVVDRVPLPERLRLKLSDAVRQGLRGIAAFHHPQRLVIFLALTAVIWMLDAVATVVGAAALGFNMPFAVALLLIAGLGLGSALPSTPGYVGIYQFVAVTVLTPFGFSKTDAIWYILVAQALNYVVIGVWGAFGLLRYRRLRRSI